MKKKYIKNEEIRYAYEISITKQCRVVVDGEEREETETIYRPSEEQILADGWEIYDNREEMYEDRVVELIRQRYTVNQELAILRQRDSKADEFGEYNSYVEECKATARKEVYDDAAS